MIRSLCIVLLFVAAPATAASRTYSVGSFERLRVEGPFEVRVVTGQSPGARAEGDARLIERLDIAVSGTTLTVRLGGQGWGETPAASGPPPVITLMTPRLTSATIESGARVVIGRMVAQKIVLSVTGAGSLALTTADADQLDATLIGTGTLSVGGRAQRARLTTSGPGAIDARLLTVNDLIVRLEGEGETRASARYTAQVTSTGLGKVTVTGGAKCQIKAIANGPVVCGATR